MGCSASKEDENKEYNKILNKPVQLKGEMLFSETQGKPEDHYETLENLGTNLWKVKNKISGFIRSMKVINKTSIEFPQDENNFMKELAILRTLVRELYNILGSYKYRQYIRILSG
jgi:hypothetical protein